MSEGTIATAGPSLDRLFQALSDEKRVRVLELLRDGERCVCDLTEALDVAQSLLSFHLRSLKDAGLVSDRREGRWVYYSLAPGALAEAAAWLGDLAEPAGARGARGSGARGASAATDGSGAVSGKACC